MTQEGDRRRLAAISRERSQPRDEDALKQQLAECQKDLAVEKLCTAAAAQKAYRTERQLAECRAERDDWRRHYDERVKACDVRGALLVRAHAVLSYGDVGMDASLRGGIEAVLAPKPEPLAIGEHVACTQTIDGLKQQLADSRAELELTRTELAAALCEGDDLKAERDKERERFNSHKARAHVLVASLQDEVAGLRAERDGLLRMMEQHDSYNVLAVPCTIVGRECGRWHVYRGEIRGREPVEYTELKDALEAALFPTPETSDGAVGEAKA